MRRTDFFIPALKEFPNDAETNSHRWLLRAGYIRPVASGVYSLLPLGLRVKQNIINIIREEMNALGGLEFELPSLQTSELWQRSGRWQSIGTEMFRFQDRHGAQMCLGMTHEELFTSLAKEIRSYKDLPTIWYQLSKKFRDEPRPKGGLLRLREFTMKDSYSFCLEPSDLDNIFTAHEQAYKRIFSRCGIDVVVVSADNGAMGGSDSREFMALLDAGEDTLVVAPSGLAANQEIWNLQEGDDAPDGSGKVTLKQGLELGHIFKLGTRYSETLSVKLQNKHGIQQPLIIGSYGIGVERLMSAIAEASCDDKGLVWNKAVAPFEVVLLELGDTQGKAEEIYKTLSSRGVNVFHDDRSDRAGVKFAEAEMIGIPTQVVVSARDTERVEVRDRKTGEARESSLHDFYKESGVY